MTTPFDAEGSASAVDSLASDHAHDDLPVVAWGVWDPEFSSREAEIVFLLTHGLSNRQIADAIFISINSVKTHIRSAYRKMGVGTRSQALLWGIDHGWRPLGAGPTWVCFVATEPTGPAAAVGER